MSDHVIGFVGAITSKEAGKNKNLLYSVCLEGTGEGGKDEWFGYGWDEPTFTKGAEIEFDIQWNGDFPNVDNDTLNVLADGEPKRSSGGSRSGGNSRSGGRSGGRSSSGGRGGNRSSSSSSRSSSNSSSRSSSPARGGNKAKGKGADTTMSKDEWADKDRMIRRQACMNTAIKLVGLLLAEGTVTIPKKKADAYDAVVALCDEEAERLYDQYEEQVYGGGTKRSSGRNEDRYEDDIPQ